MDLVRSRSKEGFLFGCFAFCGSGGSALYTSLPFAPRHTDRGSKILYARWNEQEPR
ncbi:hypothetical protein BJY01DRAFT_226422 [Aspergillus pseudoustus]|uniref:Uncharacterized protein n=1 Tax=Aspergillus pseudoustus TaxID=1810923 RepID=A0ABR4IV97_9EURO